MTNQQTTMENTQKYHIEQQGTSDCGVACLKSVLRYFGSDAPLERLRELSGTTTQGTTMLGLLQSACALGLDTEGYESDMQSLVDCADVCILHVLIDESLAHYIVCYGFDIQKQAFIISDPSKIGITMLSVAELDKIWVSKSLLLLKPTDKLVKTSVSKSAQWSWLRDFFSPDWDVLGIALVLGIAIAVLGLSTAVFSQKLIDKILPAKEIGRASCRERV